LLTRRLGVRNPSSFMSFIPIASFFLPHFLAPRESSKSLIDPATRAFSLTV
jgi:hypothetical protein